MNKYPELNLTTLRAIEQLRQTPDILNDPECPYQDWVKRLIVPVNQEFLDLTDYDDGEDINLAEETARVYKKLRDYGESLAPSDVAAYNTYFRTSAALLEKLLHMQEQATLLTRWKEYIYIVLEFLGDQCTVDQRNEFDKRLQSLEI